MYHRNTMNYQNLGDKKGRITVRRSLQISMKFIKSKYLCYKKEKN